MSRCKYYREYSTKYHYFPETGELGYCAGHSNKEKCFCCGDTDKCQFKLCESEEQKGLVENTALGDFIWKGIRLELPLNPWFSDATKQVFSCNIFEEMVSTRTIFEDFEKMLDAYIRARKMIFGVTCSNHEEFLVKENKRFSFLISYENKHDVFCVWDDNSRSLGHYIIDKKDVPSKEFIEWIDTITDNYCQHRINCSDCGNTMDIKEIAGRYFAGVYCKDCWENRGWKKREAAETYD